MPDLLRQRIITVLETHHVTVAGRTATCTCGESAEFETEHEAREAIEKHRGSAVATMLGEDGQA